VGSVLVVRQAEAQEIVGKFLKELAGKKRGGVSNFIRGRSEIKTFNCQKGNGGGADKGQRRHLLEKSLQHTWGEERGSTNFGDLPVHGASASSGKKVPSKRTAAIQSSSDQRVKKMMAIYGNLGWRNRRREMNRTTSIQSHEKITTTKIKLGRCN